VILHRIELHHVARFSERVQLGPLSPGLNVLAAYNEQGKSTIVRAAARGFFDRHTTRADEIKWLQPVGTEFGPEVTIEFDHARGRYQLKKRFLQRPECVLAEWAEDRWREIAQGDSADQRVFEMMGCSQPGRGASKPEHWGLLRYLWGRQDEPALWPEWQGAPGDRIRRCLAKLEMDPTVDRLMAGLQGESEKVFTPTGQVKKSGELFTLQEQIAAAGSELNRARQRLQDIEGQQEKYRQTALEIGHLQELARKHREEAERLQEQVRELETVRREINSTQEAFQIANSQLQAVDADLKQSILLQETLVATQRQQELLRDQQKQLARRDDELQARLREAEREISTLESGRRLSQDQTTRLRLLVRWHEAQSGLAANQAKATAIGKLQNEIEAKARERASVPRISAKQLETIRQSERDIREIELRLEASGLKIELTPEQPRSLVLGTEHGSRKIDVAPGIPALVQARRRARLQLTGWGEVSITSGAHELEQLEQELAVKTLELARLRETLGITDTIGIESLYLRGRDLDQEMKSLERQLQALLEPHRTAAAFRDSTSMLNGKFEALNLQLGSISSTESETPALEWEARLTEAEAKMKSLEQRLQRATEERQACQGAHAKLLREQSDAQAQAAIVKGEHERTVGQLQILQQRYPNGFETARSQAQQIFVQAEARLNVTRSKLPADADHLPQRRDRMARAAVEAEQNLEARRAEMNRLEGALALAAADGTYSQLTELEERSLALQARSNALQRRAQAARLVHALIARRKSAAVRTVLAPLEQSLSSCFAELTGDSARSVFLDENLQIVGIGRSREPRDLLVFENLSQGAKEQLLLCLRAAAALELAATEPQLLILDDVLVNTDSIRQSRVLDFLTNLAQRLQILILTCHPDRYAGVGQALSITNVA
jgi:DNA repair exonuclease SbcCD ATPase subunit